MRIKLRCPHCGDWFTLNLGIENGEAESRESGERQVEEGEVDEEPARRPARLSRARLIAGISAVAAVVLIVWAVAALGPGRRAARTGADAVSARATPVGTEVGPDAGSPAGVSEEGASPSDADAAPGGDDHPIPDTDDALDAVGGAGAGAPVVEAAATEPSGREAVSSAPDDVREEPQEVPRQEPQEEPRAAPREEPREATTEAVPPAALSRELLELELVATERCWIRVRADGVVVADATLEAGERRSWRADGFFDLDVGAGDAVSLTLNGEDLGPAGSDARVVEGLRVTRDGLRGR